MRQVWRETQAAGEQGRETTLGTQVRGIHGGKRQQVEMYVFKFESGPAAARTKPLYMGRCSTN